MQRKHGISVVIPCLNEEKTIEYVVKRGLMAFAKYNIPGEVIVVDNNSTDRTRFVAEAAGARVVAEHTRGYGSAYYAGVKNAQYEYSMKADADGSYDLDLMDRFWSKLHEAPNRKIVLGSRFKGEIMPGAMPFLNRHLGTPVLTMLINLLYRERLSDINSGMRAFPTQMLIDLDLKCKGMEFASEMLVKAIKKGIPIQEIPINLYKDRRDRKPHLRPFRDGWRHLKFIIQMTPFHLFFYPGLISIFLGVLLSIFLLALDVSSNVLPGERSIVGITTFACIQNFIIFGVALIFFSYVSKSRLISSGIDIQSDLFVKLKRRMNSDGVLIGSAVGVFLASVLEVYIFSKLYLFYRQDAFSPFYTKLGIFDFTLIVSMILVFFGAFFVSMTDEY